MSKFNVDAALKRLNKIAEDEYGSNYAKAINTPDEELTVRRMARLAGIEMKYPFAKAEKMSGHTQTGALQMWKFRGDLLNSKGKGSAEFDALKRTRSYELAFQVYQELKARNDPETRGGFEHFLQNCHAESNWFLAASF